MSAHPRVLLDRAQERQFTDLGYVVVEQVADADAVARLRALYLEIHPSDPEHADRRPPGAGLAPRGWDQQSWPGTHFLTGVNEISPADRVRMEEQLAPMWAEVLAGVLDRHEALVSSFLMKWPDGNSVMPLHQDPSFTDERAHRSLTVWIALDDATVALDNGPLHVVPRSHRLSSEERGSGTSQSYADDFERLWLASKPIDVRSGDALLIDSRLVHGSPPNRSSRPRLAVGVVCVPVGVQLVHALREDRECDEVQLVAVDAELYRSRSPLEIMQDPPSGAPVLAVVPAVARPLDVDVLLAADAAPSSWWARAKARRSRRRSQAAT